MVCRSGASLDNQAGDHLKDLTQALTRIATTASPRRKRLLVVEDDPAQRLSIVKLLGHEDIDVESG